MKLDTVFGAFRRALLACCVTATLAHSSVQAELPPGAYQKMQREAPEEVRIEVMGVETRSRKEYSGTTVNVKLTATIRGVTRSATKLREGSVITVEYVHRDEDVPKPGPSEVPILERCKNYPAFLELSKEPATYRPVAGGYSFDKLPPEERKEA